MQLLEIAREYGAAGLILLGVSVIFVRYIVPLTQSVLLQYQQDRELERAARSAAQAETVATWRAMAEENRRALERTQEANLKSLHELSDQVGRLSEQVNRMSGVLVRLANRMSSDDRERDRK